jgi:hypothetical protein
LAPEDANMSIEAPRKPYWEMTTAELAEATADLDQEFIMDKFSPLTPAERAQWERAKRKRGRPVKGSGAKTIAVSLERGLLARSDRYARKLGLTRSALVAQGLEAVINHRHKE